MNKKQGIVDLYNSLSEPLQSFMKEHYRYNIFDNVMPIKEAVKCIKLFDEVIKEHGEDKKYVIEKNFDTGIPHQLYLLGCKICTTPRSQLRVEGFTHSILIDERLLMALREVTDRSKKGIINMSKIDK